MSYGYGKLHTFFGTAAALCRLTWKIRREQWRNRKAHRGI